MGFFDSFKKKTEEQGEVVAQAPVNEAQSNIPNNVPFDEEQMLKEKKEEALQATQNMTPVTQVAAVPKKEDVEVLDPGVDLSKVGLCKNCGQKIIPGSTTCVLCGKPVK